MNGSKSSPRMPFTRTRASKQANKTEKRRKNVQKRQRDENGFLLQERRCGSNQRSIPSQAHFRPDSESVPALTLTYFGSQRNFLGCDSFSFIIVVLTGPHLDSSFRRAGFPNSSPPPAPHRQCAASVWRSYLPIKGAARSRPLTSGGARLSEALGGDLPPPRGQMSV